jgi:hypothetical protein
MRILIAIFLYFTVASSVLAQDTVSTTTTLFENFKRTDLLKLTLETDTKLLVNKKYKEEWQPTLVKLNDLDGQAIEWNAKIRTRGNIRKKVCYYPPVKLKFKKKWLHKNELDSAYNDLKIVIGCKKGDYYGNLVLKEYLAYNLYEALTNISFRTQLAEIEFIDSNDKWKPFTTYAFFIENEDEMAARLNATCARPKRLSSKRFFAKQFDLMTLFQYMIGNTDWSAITSHNVRIIKCRDYPLPLPVAYDFDYSGLVNAPYAVHGQGIDLEHITDRMYLGMCREANEWESTIALFNEKKEILYNIVNNFEYLPEKERGNIIRYLDDFYGTINHPKRFKRNILNACREKGR